MRKNNEREEGVMEQLEALGYIDPGAGSSAFQLLLASFFRASRIVKSFLRKVLGSGRPDNREKPNR